jgi:hypothetical protein
LGLGESVLGRGEARNSVHRRNVGEDARHNLSPCGFESGLGHSGSKPARQDGVMPLDLSHTR